MNSNIIKAAEQRCLELGQKKRSRKFTFELFEQRMASMKDQWTEQLWSYEEADYIASRLTATLTAYLIRMAIQRNVQMHYGFITAVSKLKLVVIRKLVGR